MPDIQNIIFIGAGNVATNLATAFHQKGKHIMQVYSRTKESAQALAVQINTSYTNAIEKIMPDADLYIISLNDDALPEIARQLPINNSIVVHTSGSLPMDILNNHPYGYGVFYPLQSFKKDYSSDFQTIPLLIEANSSQIQNQLLALAHEISNQAYIMNSEQRKWVHLSAVFACNFGNFMTVIAEDILNKKDIPFAILRPLLQQMNERLQTTSPQQLQTGPAIRKDYKIIQEHIKCLENEPDYQAIYQLLSNNIMKKF